MTTDQLARILFDFWKKTKIKEGYHLPSRCPVYERNSDNADIQENADIIHCGRCSSQLCSYEELDEYAQDEYKTLAEEYLANNS